jgi:hypothetical protein
MELLDNVNRTMGDDLKETIQKESRIRIASATFSIYAFQELKKQLEGVEEFNFIFTSPTFVKEHLRYGVRGPSEERIDSESHRQGMC